MISPIFENFVALEIVEFLKLKSTKNSIVNHPSCDLDNQNIKAHG
jgi:hypothetical protein